MAKETSIEDRFREIAREEIDKTEVSRDLKDAVRDVLRELFVGGGSSPKPKRKAEGTAAASDWAGCTHDGKHKSRAWCQKAIDKAA